jgi:hypothetical protein
VQGTQPPPPIVVRIVEPRTELQGLSDVLIGSLGLAGGLIVAGLVLAAIFALGLVVWRRYFQREAEPEDLHIV